ncbi:Asp23/Gls24 family envelope stress response protein [Candidatus Aerophobetes bacterium]|uniref:Asp23/Gls24 family envelope stress response protein n=1 Tax=Aerophobetes bacterium TaxID=2030807 RepID=A0A523TDA7_UNCAE|nr:MAG: Asp23/Gls24 family envelope stress response protein [Candidatus Aerophobetes bacterium]
MDKKVTLELIVEEGTLIPRVVEEVQKKVSEEIQRSLGNSVARVNIKIKGIKFSSK